MDTKTVTGLGGHIWGFWCHLNSVAVFSSEFSPLFNNVHIITSRTNNTFTPIFCRARWMDVGSDVSPMNNLHCDAAFWRRRHITFKSLSRTITRNDQRYWCCMDNSLLKQIPSGCRNLDFKTVWHHFTVVCTLIPNEFVFKLCPWWSSHNGTVVSVSLYTCHL